MQLVKILGAAVALLLAPRFAGEALAQAWLQAVDGYYFKVSASFLSTDEAFDFRGDRTPVFEDSAKTDTSFRDISFSAYLEYGVTDYLTLVASVPFKIVTSKETSMGIRNVRTNGGLGDLFIAARTPILKNPAVSVQAGIKVPLGYEQNPDNGGPPLGTGEADAEVQLLYGQSLWPIPAYVSAGAGYRFRGGSGARDLATVGAIGGLNDEIFYHVEAGYTAGQVFLKLRLDALLNTEDPPDLSPEAQMTASGSPIEVVAGDQDIIKLTPGVTYTVGGNVALNVELFHTLSGKNTVTGTAISLGVVYTR